MPKPQTATLVITRRTLPKGCLEKIAQRLPDPWQFNLFFVHYGALLAGNPLPALPRQADRMVCAFSHQFLKAPPPTEETETSSLFDLGSLVRDSDLTLSAPQIHWPHPKTPPGEPKNIGLLIDQNATQEQTKQTLRAAAALAAREHTIDVYQKDQTIPGAPAVAEAFLEALEEMNGRLLPFPDNPDALTKHDAILAW